MIQAKSKFRGAFKLSAVGDALGWITEFEKSRNSLKEKYGAPEIITFQEWEKKVGGRFWGHIEKIEAGAYSDDTQLTLSVARSIKANGTSDLNYFAKIELPSWLEYARGAGRTIKLSAKKIQRKSADWNNNFYSVKRKKGRFQYTESGANGAAMRVLPIALVNAKNPNQLFNDIFANSIVTHGHSRAIVGALFYGLCIRYMLLCDPGSLSRIEYLVYLGDQLEKDLLLNNVENEKIKSWANNWSKQKGINFRKEYEKTIQEVLKFLRIIYRELLKGENSDEFVLRKLGCYDPDTLGSGVGTVSGGLFLALKYAETPEKAIVKAVNLLGTDTDSIAAFCGGILGSLYGEEAIPEKWHAVQDYNYLESVSDQIYLISKGEKLDEAHSDINGYDLSINKSLIRQFQDLKLEIDDWIQYVPLGNGKIVEKKFIDCFKKDKKTVVYKVQFDIGQLCTFTYVVGK